MVSNRLTKFWYDYNKWTLVLKRSIKSNNKRGQEKVSRQFQKYSKFKKSFTKKLVHPIGETISINFVLSYEKWPLALQFLYLNPTGTSSYFEIYITIFIPKLSLEMVASYGSTKNFGRHVSPWRILPFSWFYYFLC